MMSERYLRGPLSKAHQLWKRIISLKTYKEVEIVTHYPLGLLNCVFLRGFQSKAKRARGTVFNIVGAHSRSLWLLYFERHIRFYFKNLYGMLTMCCLICLLAPAGKKGRERERAIVSRRERRLPTQWLSKFDGYKNWGTCWESKHLAPSPKVSDSVHLRLSTWINIFSKWPSWFSYRWSLVTLRSISQDNNRM